MTIEAVLRGGFYKGSMKIFIRILGFFLGALSRFHKGFIMWV